MSHPGWHENTTFRTWKHRFTVKQTKQISPRAIVYADRYNCQNSIWAKVSVLSKVSILDNLDQRTWRCWQISNSDSFDTNLHCFQQNAQGHCWLASHFQEKCYATLKSSKTLFLLEILYSHCDDMPVWERAFVCKLITKQWFYWFLSKTVVLATKCVNLPVNAGKFGLLKTTVLS